MFCSKCGHEVDEDDAFCRNCGAPIHQKKEVHSISPGDSKLPEQQTKVDRSMSFLHSWSKTKKFIIYTIAATIFMAMLGIILLPRGVSAVEFMTDSRGFTAFWGFYIGAAIPLFILFLPLISGLHKLGVTKETYRIEGFYVILLLNTFLSVFFGYSVWSRQYLPPIVFGGFIVGVIVWIIGKCKDD